MINAEFTPEDRTEFWKECRRMHRLPSLETQVLKWFSIDSTFGIRSRHLWNGTNCQLEPNGFQVYVRGMQLRYDSRELWVFAIARVEIPER